MNSNGLKVLGIIAFVIGAAADLLTDWIDDKKLDEKIDKRIEAYANRSEETES